VRKLLLVAVGTLVAVLLPAAAAFAGDGYGAAPVTVADRNVAPAGQPRLLSVDVGHHDGYDRVVFRFSSRVPGYTVRYVGEVRQDGSDRPVPLAGSAFLVVTLHSVASGQVGAPPAPQDRSRPDFPQLREIAGAGDFEGYVSFGLGLAHRSGFRAYPLSNPDRLVVDLRIPATAPTTSTATPGSIGATPPGPTGAAAAPTGPAAPPPTAAPAPPTATPAAATSLPHTGVPVAIIATAAAALLLAGAAGLRLTRRSA